MSEGERAPSEESRSETFAGIERATPPRPWRLVVAVLSLLALGAVLGVTADRLLHRRVDAVAAHPMSFSEHVRTVDRAQVIERLERQLGLRPDQRERIAALLEHRQGDIDAAWDDAQAHVDATAAKVLDEIEALLEPHQVEPFRRLVREVHGERPHARSHRSQGDR